MFDAAPRLVAVVGGNVVRAREAGHARIELGTGVIDMRYENPWALAEQVKTITDNKGTVVTQIDEKTVFICYIVADLTSSLLDRLSSTPIITVRLAPSRPKMSDQACRCRCTVSWSAAWQQHERHS